MNELFTIAGIGELLWDVFPSHNRPGGAPANFACHCHRLGAQARPVSCVGTDELGLRIPEEIRGMGGDGSSVLERVRDFRPERSRFRSMRAASLPIILENVAWDHIPLTDGLKALAETLDAVCFGSLAQCSAVSRETIRAFVRYMPGERHWGSST